jgi:hypothetical protein
MFFPDNDLANYETFSIEEPPEYPKGYEEIFEEYINTDFSAVQDGAFTSTSSDNSVSDTHFRLSSDSLNEFGISPMPDRDTRQLAEEGLIDGSFGSDSALFSLSANGKALSHSAPRTNTGAASSDPLFSLDKILLQEPESGSPTLCFSPPLSPLPASAFSTTEGGSFINTSPNSKQHNPILKFPATRDSYCRSRFLGAAATTLSQSDAKAQNTSPKMMRSSVYKAPQHDIWTKHLNDPAAPEYDAKKQALDLPYSPPSSGSCEQNEFQSQPSSFSPDEDVHNARSSFAPQPRASHTQRTYFQMTPASSPSINSYCFQQQQQQQQQQQHQNQQYQACESTTVNHFNVTAPYQLTTKMAETVLSAQTPAPTQHSPTLRVVTPIMSPELGIGLGITASKYANSGQQEQHLQGFTSTVAMASPNQSQAEADSPQPYWRTLYQASFPKDNSATTISASPIGDINNNSSGLMAMQLLQGVGAFATVDVRDIHDPGFDYPDLEQLNQIQNTPTSPFEADLALGANELDFYPGSPSSDAFGFEIGNTGFNVMEQGRHMRKHSPPRPQQHPSRRSTRARPASQPYALAVSNLSASGQPNSGSHHRRKSSSAIYPRLPHPSRPPHNRTRSAHISSAVAPDNQDHGQNTVAVGYSAGRGIDFVNFTPSDSRKILTGVAPSGSSKTKARREREAVERRRKLSAVAKAAVLKAGGDLGVLEREGLLVE